MAWKFLKGKAQTLFSSPQVCSLAHGVSANAHSRTGLPVGSTRLCPHHSLFAINKFHPSPQAPLSAAQAAHFQFRKAWSYSLALVLHIWTYGFFSCSAHPSSALYPTSQLKRHLIGALPALLGTFLVYFSATGLSAVSSGRYRLLHISLCLFV